MATAPRPSEPYRFPFATRGEGLAFVAGTPGGADAAAAYCRLYRGADYLRWADGGTITTERITCRSGGLSIRGLLVRPRTPGPHPVPILHGGVGQRSRIVLPDILEMNRLAERGHVVVSSAFRGEGGSEGRPDTGGDDVADALAPNAAILILHGGDDPRVEPTDALRMATALQRLKQSHRLNIHEGGAHDLIADLGDVRAEMDRWSDRYVGDLTPPPANAAVPLADTP